MTSGPLFALPQPLHLFLRWQNNSTAQSHCHQHNITVAEVSPEADSVYTSTTTDLLYLEKKRTSASPSSRLDSKKKNKQTQRRGDATRHVTMRDIFSSHSGAWRQCLEAVTLSIGQHKRVFVMAICWHPVWRRKKQWRLKEKMLLVSAAVTSISIRDLILHLEAAKQFSQRRRVSKPIKCLSRPRRRRLKWPLTQRELRRQAYKQNKEAKEEKKKRAHVWTTGGRKKKCSNRSVINWII